MWRFNSCLQPIKSGRPVGRRLDRRLICCSWTSPVPGRREPHPAGVHLGVLQETQETPFAGLSAQA